MYVNNNELMHFTEHKNKQFPDTNKNRTNQVFTLAHKELQF